VRVWLQPCSIAFDKQHERVTSVAEPTSPGRSASFSFIGSGIASMGADEVNAFLTSLAVESNVAVSTQNQALSALLFLYRDVLGDPLPWIADIGRAQRRNVFPLCSRLRRSMPFWNGSAACRIWLRCFDRINMLPGVALVWCGSRSARRAWCTKAICKAALGPFGCRMRVAGRMEPLSLRSFLESYAYAWPCAADQTHDRPASVGTVARIRMAASSERTVATTVA